MRLPSAVFVLGLAGVSARAQTVQYRSPAGVEYRAQADTGPVARAQAALASDPRNVDKIIALGVAQSGARQFREAIATFTRGIEIAPNNAILYRWRGHRYLSVRELDRALADFNRGNQLDSAVYGIWYHLGIVRYLRGDFAGAAAAFKRAQPRAPDPGELAGSTDWLWMSLSRAGRGAEAKAMLDRRPDSLPTTAAYAQRLRLYRGEIGPDQVLTPADTADVQAATLSYGIGNWYLVRGDTAKARTWFERSIKSGGWPGFGFMASEVELRRLGAPRGDAFDTAYVSLPARLGAVPVSVYLGFGLGHAVVGEYGEAGRQFTMLEGGAVIVAVAGFAIGYDHRGLQESAGAALFYGGAVAVAISRLWEIVDVVVRPTRHNILLDERKRTAAPRLSLVPVADRRRAGLATSFAF